MTRGIERAALDRRPARASVGRADLVRLVARLPPEQVTSPAALLGFEQARAIEVQAPVIATPAKPADAVRPEPEGAPMPLWRAERMAFTEGPPERPREASPRPKQPLSEDDLTSPGRSLFATPRAEPLTPWSRLWPALRAALQASVPGRDPDVAHLVRAWCRGEVVHRIPRVKRRVWAGRASVWVDWSERLLPFRSDQVDVCRRLRAACGQSGLDLRLLDAREQAWAIGHRGDFLAGFRPDPDTPVLALGDLGTYGSALERAAWLATARHLVRAGVRIAALVPSPPARWDPLVARAWAAMPWERGRQGASAPRSGAEHWPARAESLLCLASPAVLVQPGLLRALRHLLPASEADASTEADAWAHPDVRAADATGLVLHAEARGRLRRRFADVESSGPEARVSKARVSEAIGRWHAELPKEVLRAETLVWLGLISPEIAQPPGDRADALAFAARLETSMRRDASAREGGADTPLAPAVRRYARRLLSTMPAGAYEAVPALQIVWAAAFEDVAGPVPEGLDPFALRGELRRPGEPRWWAVRHVGDRLVFSPSPDAAWPSHERGRGSPVTWMQAAEPHLVIKYSGEAFKTRLVLEEGLSLPLRSGGSLELRTDCHTATLRVESRPAWANAGAGRDRFGLWADVEVNGIVQRFRWIPSGRFRMGSPEGEAERYDDEGPQHTVTWTEGRWLADTPVTQALWVAVMGKNPSEFQSADRPVERVSWDDCQEFLRRLGELAPGLEARLPSEAEWEYACRAGTQTATWLGDLEIVGESNAPLLDSMAWYSGNCGVEFELENGQDISSWEEKQYDEKRGGTHPVQRRRANPFGLYDMLGNVWEWCEDAWGYTYEDNERVDPAAFDSAGSSRVMRGGSWSSSARLVRAALRYAYPPGDRDSSVGFRLARGHAPGPGAEPRPRSGSVTRDAGRGTGQAPARDATAPPGRRTR